MNINIIKKYSILIPIIVLLSISIFSMYSFTNLGNKQLIISLLSIILIILFSKINIKFLINNSFYIYLFNLFLLVLVLFIGRSINGSRAWIDFYYFKFQPSELMKISLLLVLLKYKDSNILYILLLTIIPSILVYLEPDTGSLIFYFIILFCLLIYSKNKYVIPILSITLLLGLVFIYIYFYYQDTFIKIFGNSIFYRIDRLISFKSHSNIQLENALISIGAHSCLNFPEYHNDFIFAYLLCNFKIYIFVVIIITYLFIFYYFTKNYSFINISLVYILIFQIFYNILMNLGLVPIIGIPLPFLSYGGSYLITLCILIGLSINMDNMDTVDMDSKVLD